MGCRVDEQVEIGQTLKDLGLPNRRQPVRDRLGGGWAPKRRTYFQDQLRLHFSRKTRARKERLLRQEATARIAQPRAGERRKPEPTRPRAATRPTHLPLHLQTQPVRDLPDLVDVGEHLIICSGTYTRRSRYARGPSGRHFPRRPAARGPRPSPGARNPDARPKHRPSSLPGRRRRPPGPRHGDGGRLPAPTHTPVPCARR